MRYIALECFFMFCNLSNTSLELFIIQKQFTPVCLYMPLQYCLKWVIMVLKQDVSKTESCLVVHLFEAPYLRTCARGIPHERRRTDIRKSCSPHPLIVDCLLAPPPFCCCIYLYILLLASVLNTRLILCAHARSEGYCSCPVCTCVCVCVCS